MLVNILVKDETHDKLLLNDTGSLRNIIGKLARTTPISPYVEVFIGFSDSTVIHTFSSIKEAMLYLVNLRKKRRKHDSKDA